MAREAVVAAGRRPIVLGHRGASAEAPENTLAAFRLAVEQGADGVELDVWRCRSGEVVVHHDVDTARVAGVAHRLGSTRWDELRRLDVGSWKGQRFAGERIPLLAEVLEALPSAVVNVELKSTGWPDLSLARAVAGILRDAGAEERCLVSSFDYVLLAAFRLAARAVGTGILFAARPRWRWRAEAGIRAVFPRTARRWRVRRWIGRPPYQLAPSGRPERAELLRELFRCGGRQAAGPALAQVGGGPSGDGLATSRDGRHRGEREEGVVLGGPGEGAAGQEGAADEVQHRRRRCAVPRPDEDELPRSILKGVEPDRELRERHRLFGQGRRVPAQGRLGHVPEAGIAGERLQAHGVEERHRGARGLGAVVRRLLAREELLLVRARDEPATAWIGEEALDRLAQRHGLGEPARLERRLVEVEQALSQEGVIGEEAGGPERAVLEGAGEPAGGAHVIEDETCRSRRRLDVEGLAENPPAEGERGDHEPVPRGQDLVVAEGGRAAGAGHVQPGPRFGQRGPAVLVRCRDREDVPPLEVSAGSHAIERAELSRLLAEHLADLGLVPQEEAALLALGIGVGGRVEGEPRRGQLAQHISSVWRVTR